MNLTQAINRFSLEETTLRLGKIGMTGEFSTSRPAWSRQETAAIKFLGSLCRWTRTVDPFGNTFFTRPGRKDLRPILIGSHPDTVTNGGIFDGASGCIAAIQILDALDLLGVETDHPIAAAFLRGEESSRFNKALLGSREFCGLLPADDLDSLRDGEMTLRQAMASQGFTPDGVAWDKPVQDRAAAWFELHIEQGPHLGRANLPLGTVTRFCGTWRAVVEIFGEATHSSLTQDIRLDAGSAARRMTVAIEDLVNYAPRSGYPVATIGVFDHSVDSEAPRGEMNVSPGYARFTIDFRGTDEAELARLGESAVEIIERIARERSRDLSRENGTLRPVIKRMGLTKPTATTPELCEIIRQSAAAHGYGIQDMLSGAGHDGVSFLLAGVPVGMLFVQSSTRDGGSGYSHCKHEVADFDHLHAGTVALAEAVMRADKILD